MIVGTLSGLDENSDESLVFDVVGGANGTLFEVVGGNGLAIVHAGQTGNNLEVMVRVVDHGGLSYSTLFSVSESEYLWFDSYSLGCNNRN